MTADELKPRAFAWENLDRLNPERSHYSVFRLSGEGGIGSPRRRRNREGDGMADGSIPSSSAATQEENNEPI